MTKAVSSLLGGGAAPTPQPVPIAPSASEADAAARAEAARVAEAERIKGGRRATMAAGGDLASEDQLARGLLKSKQRRDAAAKDVLG